MCLFGIDGFLWFSCTFSSPLFCSSSIRVYIYRPDSAHSKTIGFRLVEIGAASSHSITLEYCAISRAFFPRVHSPLRNSSAISVMPMLILRVYYHE